MGGSAISRPLFEKPNAQPIDFWRIPIAHRVFCCLRGPGSQHNPSQAGVPAAVAQAMIGHDSEAIHQHYVSVGWTALEQAAASLPDLG